MLTDGKCKITGTQRINLVDATNNTNVKKAVSQVEKLEKDSWALVKACNPDPEIEKLIKERNKAQKNLPKMKDQLLFLL